MIATTITRVPRKVSLALRRADHHADGLAEPELAGEPKDQGEDAPGRGQPEKRAREIRSGDLEAFCHVSPIGNMPQVDDLAPGLFYRARQGIRREMREVKGEVEPVPGGSEEPSRARIAASGSSSIPATVQPTSRIRSRNVPVQQPMSRSRP